jgi:hypothetical protein
LGEANVLARNPSPVLQSNGEQWVWFRGTNNALDFWRWNGKEWKLGWLGEGGLMGGEPSPLLKANGEESVYFGGSNGSLDFWYWNGKEWGLNWLGAEV